MKRNFLVLVGLAYLFLAVWCSLKPLQTSRSVGFILEPGSGQSEFLTVYGGLEFALGAYFMLPLIRPSATTSTLLFCLWLHGGLVVFRTIGFVLFHDIPITTSLFAGLEWAILLGATYCFFSKT